MWEIASSRIEFENGKVSEYSNYSNNLKIKLIPKKANSTSLGHFTIGSPKDEVLQIQSTGNGFAECCTPK